MKSSQEFNLLSEIAAEKLMSCLAQLRATKKERRDMGRLTYGHFKCYSTFATKKVFPFEIVENFNKT